MTERRTFDLVVVGGGVAGLTVAHDAARVGRSVLLLEAQGRVGGLVAPLPVTVGGGQVVLDAGAEAMGTRRPAALDLARELGLAVEHPAAVSWVQPAGGAARPVPPGSLLGIPGDLTHPAVVGLLGAEEAEVASRRDGGAAPGGGAERVSADGPTSLAEFVRAAMGEAVLERLVRPIVGALHAAAPEDLDVDVVAPGLQAARGRTGSLGAAVRSLVGDRPAVATVRGGMHRLPAALLDAARAAGVEVRTGRAVAALTRDGDGWLAHSTGSSAADRAAGTADAATMDAATRTTDRARQVVLALPGPAALGLLDGHVPSAAEVRLTRGAPVEHLTLLLDAPALDAAPRGSGLIVEQGARPDGRPVRAKAVTHASAKWPWVAAHLDGRHAVRLSYGRPGQRPRPIDVEEALADASALLGVGLNRNRLLAHAPFSHSGALAPQTPATRAAVATLADDAAAAGLHLTGAWVAGTGLPAVVAHARDLAPTL